jgi:hypothetical protein
MEYKKYKNFEGEIIEVPVINAGDKISVLFEDIQDEDLAYELEEFEGDLIVIEVDYDQYQVYVEGIDYAIDIEFIKEVI